MSGRQESDGPSRPPKVTVPLLRGFKAQGRKVTVLTAYDATFARLFDGAGIDVLLVGDSLGMVVQGQSSTLPVTLDEMIYHCRAVARGSRTAHLVCDMPFMSYQASIEEGMRNAGRLIKEGGAEAVKLEGGEEVAELVGRLTRSGIPVMGHVGLMPQSVHMMGGYRVQGRSHEAADRVRAAARAVAQAGAYAIVLEGVPAPLAAEITASTDALTIGIGAGAACDGQVLVSYDLLGLDEGFKPKFVKRYDELGARVREACKRYVDEVRAGTFPDEAHSFAGDERPLRGVALVK